MHTFSFSNKLIRTVKGADSVVFPLNLYKKSVICVTANQQNLQISELLKADSVVYPYIYILHKRSVVLVRTNQRNL